MKTIAAGFGLLVTLGASPYIEALYPLQQFMAESEVIAEGVIEKTDLKTRTSIVKITKSLKGKSHYELIKMNIGASGFEGHADATLPHLVAGAPVVIFYDAGRRGEIYVNRFFMQLYGDPAAPPDKAWWTFTHVEIRCNRTYNGPADELAKLIADIQEGKAKPPAPDPKLPSISLANMKALPVWGKPVDANSLPACFMKRDPNKKAKPREPDAPGAIVKGLACEYYEGAWNELPDFDALKPVDKGNAEQFDLSKAKRQEQIGMRFKGFIDIAKEGVYTFTTVSDDGSKLFIGKTEVVSNDGLHPPVEQAGEIALKPGKHAITVTFFENSGGEALEVYYEGPDLPKQKIPPAVLYRPASP